MKIILKDKHSSWHWGHAFHWARDSANALIMCHLPKRVHKDRLTPMVPLHTYLHLAALENTGDAGTLSTLGLRATVTVGSPLAESKLPQWALKLLFLFLCSLRLNLICRLLFNGFPKTSIIHLRDYITLCICKGFNLHYDHGHISHSELWYGSFS